MWRYCLAGFALMASGCAGMPASAPVNQTLYLLDASPDVPTAQANQNVILMVNATIARPGYDTSQMAYTQRPHELSYYATNRWVAPPARMLEPLLVSALGKTGAFHAVVTASNSVNEDLRLEVELVQLYQDFTVQPSRVVMAVRAQLINEKDGRVLSARQFDEQEAATSEDARGGADAANRALKRLLNNLVSFCLSESGGR